MARLKIYILDTTVLLYDPNLMYELGDSTIIIPTAVIKELDGIKRSEEENKAKAARQVARTLDRLGSCGDLSAGVKLPTGGILRVYTGYEGIDDLASQTDNRVIGAAIRLKKETEGRVIVLTTDTNMRTIARSYGLKGEFYPFGMDYEKAMRIEDGKSVVISAPVPLEEYLKETPVVPGKPVVSVIRSSLTPKRFLLVFLILAIVTILLIFSILSTWIINTQNIMYIF